MQNYEAPNLTEISDLSVGIVYWHEGDGTASPIACTLEDLGCEVIRFSHDARLPDGLDAVFAYGPFGSLVPLANQLLTCPPCRRPLFVLWMSEPLPDPTLPEWVRYTVGAMRSEVERMVFRQQAPGVYRVAPRLHWLTTRALRFRYYGDLHWLRRQGILSLLVVQSRLLADFLTARGFNPVLAFLGNHPDWGADLGLERDIPVLWIGKFATRRRRYLLKRIRTELRERGVEILMIDGEENPYVFGEQRTILLNRTKIVLNLLREKRDDNSMRYLLAAPNRAMIVTEPTLPHTPFLPVVHRVEAPIERMADTICYYLSHEEDRRRIADRAYQLITSEELSMRTAVSRILAQLVAVRWDAVSKSG